MASAMDLDPIEALAQKNRHLADVVQATSRRRDARNTRARIMLLLLSLRCPLSGAPRHGWYVPGAVARLGAIGLWRAWEGFFGMKPPTDRTIRKHLGDLEQACAIIRAPGDWLPTLRDEEHPERRPRYPNTIHVIDTEQAAHWWATEGKRLMSQFSRWRTNPDVWGGCFKRWREMARQHQGHLFGATSPATEAQPSREEGVELATKLARGRDPLDVMLSLRRARCHVAGKLQAAMIAGDPERLFGAAALMAAALWRGDRIRSREGWLVRAWQRAPIGELREAIAALSRGWVIGPDGTGTIT